MRFTRTKGAGVFRRAPTKRHFGLTELFAAFALPAIFEGGAIGAGALGAAEAGAGLGALGLGGAATAADLGAIAALPSLTAAEIGGIGSAYSGLFGSTLGADLAAGLGAGALGAGAAGGGLELSSQSAGPTASQYVAEGFGPVNEALGSGAFNIPDSFGGITNAADPGYLASAAANPPYEIVGTAQPAGPGALNFAPGSNISIPGGVGADLTSVGYPGGPAALESEVGNYLAATGGAPSGGAPGGIAGAYPGGAAGLSSDVASGLPGSTGTAAAKGGEGFFSSIGNLKAKDLLGPGIAAGGLGYALANQGNVSPNQAALQKTADQLAASSAEMRKYFETGTLPPGMKAAVDQATMSAKARARQNAASSGMSADPTKNSALAQQLDAIEKQAVIATAEMGQKLLQTGLSETQLSSSLYQSLVQIDQANQAAIGKAIANFAGALGNQNKGLTLKVG